MATSEDLLEQLEDLYRLINNAQINIKKCSKVRLTRGYVQSKIKGIEEYWEAYRAAHTGLLRLTTKDQRKSIEYFVRDHHGTCEEVYMCLRADLLDMLEPAALPVNTSSSSEREMAAADIKLPRINLPMYSGAYEEWQSFEDTFMTLIYNNNNLSDVQKLHYLKSCVCGEAKNTIKHFQIVKNNFFPAWETLKGRYSHKRLIVNAILKRLFSMKKISNQLTGQLKTLIDCTKECLNSLNNLQINTDTWDPIIIYLIIQKLDAESHKDWETHVSKECSDSIPALNILINFLENRIRTLELTCSTMPLRDNKIKERNFTGAALVQSTCVFCNGNHNLYNCKEFSKIEPERRKEFVKEKRLCFNCLFAGHPFYHCKQKGACKICSKRHHSLLHSSKKTEPSLDPRNFHETTGLTSMHTNVEENKAEVQDVSIASHFSSENRNVLLATAVVPVMNSMGHITMLRALIDPGSQASFVSERAVQLLRLKRSGVQGTVTGVGSLQTSVSQVVHLEVLSNYEQTFNLKVKAYVLSTHLTTMLPCKQIKRSKDWSHIQGLILADPNYYAPGKIDILLGVEVYTEILKNKFIKGHSGTPSAQETSLGWILFGSISDEQSCHTSVALCSQINFDDMVRSMWELQPTIERLHTSEERLCEKIYKDTYVRRSDGKYIVKLPMKTEKPLCIEGNTKDIAMKRLYQLEKRFVREPDLKIEYEKIINEYIDMKYIEEVPQDELNRPAVYLPHHPVIREDKETTKVRVVFDASAKGSNNISLNDELLVGPPLQEDLRNLIMRWRLRKVCFTADIQKMYLMILIDKNDADLQRILWRSDVTETPKDYRLLRVTFGTASAPYLAVKTLRQVAIDEGSDNPEAAKVIMEDFFVDDLISGRDTTEDAIDTAQEIINILEKGGFNLQKWASNDAEFLEQIPLSQRSVNASIDLKVNGIIKALGLSWNIGLDTLEYHLSLIPVPERVTKRYILSELQRLFDPLGWLAPLIVLYKLLMQRLWLEGIGWDEEVNDEMKIEWIKLRQGFQYLDEVKIPRWLYTTEDVMQFTTIHGFCDASTKAYAAVVYIRVQTKDGEIKTSIIAAKTRVAPVKPVSLPRLELCGALILSRLLKQVSEAMRIPCDKIHAWTDSTVVLSWLAGDPLKWNVFVSNRVVEITDNIPYSQWHHVTSDNNPADVASRGLSFPQLIHNTLWWAGASWLQAQKVLLKSPDIEETELESRKNFKVYCNLVKEGLINFENFDNLEELQRVIVYCKRFINSKKQPENIIKPITIKELEEALNQIVKIIQNLEFEEEIKSLKETKTVSRNSKLKSLNPFIDKNGILRVGGRLRHAPIEEDSKHPILLGHKNAVVQLIVSQAHRKTLHGGVQLMLCFIRSRFWIIKAKILVKAYIHRCLVCAIQRAKSRDQMMGDLPSVRVTPARPFLNSGVDFAGPIQILTTRGRGSKCKKAYIAIFLCMVTKAIHLELVGDLTTESFISAFKRFVSRRGKCNHIWSDRGTNFIGANKELQNLWQQHNLEIPEHLIHLLAEDGTEWHFNPPYSPNFGGLWEAGVKSVKHHLKRILTCNLTYEEMLTTLCQIEACLNSRPLCPVDETDVDSLEILTPGHFLIGEAPINISEPSLQNVNVNKLSRWQHTQKLVQNFWVRWQNEYLTQLQQRPKWQKRRKEFQIGDVVLLKEENLPPGKWALGRIVDKHPGLDNLCRVYSVKCRGKTVQRSISKICELPIND